MPMIICPGNFPSPCAPIALWMEAVTTSVKSPISIVGGALGLGVVESLDEVCLLAMIRVSSLNGCEGLDKSFR